MESFGKFILSIVEMNQVRVALEQWIIIFAALGSIVWWLIWWIWITVQQAPLLLGISAYLGFQAKR